MRKFFVFFLFFLPVFAAAQTTAYQAERNIRDVNGRFDRSSLQSFANRAQSKTAQKVRSGVGLQSNACLGVIPNREMQSHIVGFVEALVAEPADAAKKFYCGHLPTYWQKWRMDIDTDGLPEEVPEEYVYRSPLSRCILESHAQQCASWEAGWGSDYAEEATRDLFAFRMSCDAPGCICNGENDCRQTMFYLLKHLDDQLFSGKSPKTRGTR